MASCTDLNKLPSTTDHRSIMKGIPVPIFTSKKLVEPFTRLKNRANLFRRKNYSSQVDISNPRLSLPADHLIPSHEIPITDNNNLVLKRSNSMICPQQRLQTLLKTTNNHQRNSICVPLTSCSKDDYRFIKSPSTRYWNKKMSNINEQDVFPSDESFHEKKPEEVSSLRNEQLIPSVSSSSSETISIRRQSNIPFLPKRQSFEEPFYDCKQQTSPIKPTESFDIPSSKISTCTMTGKSLNNLDECLSTTSSEDKGVQTTLCIKRNNSSTSLSSSTTSIQTDSLENKPKRDKISKHKCQLESYDKWPYLSLGEQTCIYWVNYLGSTAIKILSDNTSTIPTIAINRLKLSTQYARILPIIGLTISSRGVEFLKHTKERVVICFHDIKSIHCACQDQDLRYFAYVTREQRVINGMSNSTIQQTSPSLSSKNGDYHNYCHVFVVKNESMSTEILLNFGQVFDVAYRLHHHLNSKQIDLDKSHSKLDDSRHSTKFNKIISSSTHSPATSSSSSSSIDERRYGPSGIVRDPNSNELYIADSYHDRIVSYPSGSILAGGNGPSGNSSTLFN